MNILCTLTKLVYKHPHYYIDGYRNTYKLNLYPLHFEYYILYEILNDTECRVIRIISKTKNK